MNIIGIVDIITFSAMSDDMILLSVHLLLSKHGSFSHPSPSPART